MLPLALAVGSSEVGKKAETLARARAAGVAVPDGFVVLPDEEIDEPELAARLSRLGPGPFAVRSSANLEDLPGASAAGVFLSLLPVERAGVSDAIAKVRASALGEPALAYLGARGLGRRARMAVLVQPVVAALRLGVLHTSSAIGSPAPAATAATPGSVADAGDESERRGAADTDGGRRDPIVADTGDDDDRDGGPLLVAEERAPGEPEWGQVSARTVPAESALGRGARSLAALLGGPADIEYALTDDGPVFLQARPLTAAAPRRDPSPWRLAGTDERILQRDAEHNPDPLSAAQASLVEHLNERTHLPRQEVRNGYLYVERAPPNASADEGSDAPPDLLRFFAQEIAPPCEAALAPLEGRADAAEVDARAWLDDALAAYEVVVQCSMGRLSPSLRRARGRLDALLSRGLGEGLASHGALLAGTGGQTLARDASLRALGRSGAAERPVLLATHLARYGAYSPTWDVAVPPDDEAPERVLAAAALMARAPSVEVRHQEALVQAEMAARGVLARLSDEHHALFHALLPEARAALTLAENDDALFFRAQRVVRRPLLALGRRLAGDGKLDFAEQIFELPIERALDGRIDAAAAREASQRREAQRRLDPPAAIHAGAPTWRGAGGHDVLVGAGTAGRGWGRAYLLRDPAAAAHLPSLPPGAVLVTPAILPSLTYLIPGAAGLVTDYGGALSHGATLAREYGVPAVLGTGAATRLLRDGEELLVDGDGGKVYRIGPR